MEDRFGSYIVCSGLEGTGRCWWCGGKFPDKRARRYCCEVCADKYRETYYWPFAVPAALKRANYVCQDCGFAATVSQFGYFSGKDLVVHHKEPLRSDPRTCNIKNGPGNLVVVCRPCHGKRHTKAAGSGQLTMPLLH